MQFALIGLMLLAPTSEPANEPAPAAQAAAQAGGSAAKASEPKKICKKLETTGSRTAAKKVCMTAEQWRKADLDGL